MWEIKTQMEHLERRKTKSLWYHRLKEQVFLKGGCVQMSQML